MRSIKVVLADDHTILREGLKAALMTDADIDVVGETGDGESAVELIRAVNPHVAILDINMPRLTGIEATRKIRKFNREVKILILTMHEDSGFVFDAISAGINGYVFKMAEMEELVTAIKKLFKGEDYFSDKVSAIMVKGLRGKSSTSDDSIKIILTSREKEIVKLIVDGCTSHEIAEKLFISYFTVGEHRKNILRKLGLKNTAELVSYALREKM